MSNLLAFAWCDLGFVLDILQYKSDGQTCSLPVIDKLQVPVKRNVLHSHLALIIIEKQYIVEFRGSNPVILRLVY